MAIRLSAAAGLVLAVAFATAASIARPPGWQVEAGALLATPRAAHQATLLADGRVLLTGGCSGLGCAPVVRRAAAPR